MRKLAKLLRLLRKPAYWKGLRHGVAATVEHNAFLRSHPYATMIDAGANRGQFSLAAHAERRDATIIAFEPLPHLVTTFEKIFGKSDPVRVMNLALGSQAGEAAIHVSRRQDSSSLLPIGKLQTQIFPGTEEAAVLKVCVAKLDDVLNVSELAKPVLLKIDVQGFELELLKGAEKSLTNIDSIYMELSFVPLYDGQPLAHEVVNWLAVRGFGLAGVYHVATSKDGKAVQADIHFRHID